MPLVLPIWLSRAAVANYAPRLAGVLAISGQCLRPEQSHRLCVLQRRQVHRVLKALVKAGPAHVNHFGQIANHDGLGQILMDMSHGSRNPLDLPPLLQKV